MALVAIAVSLTCLNAKFSSKVAIGDKTPNQTGVERERERERARKIRLRFVIENTHIFFYFHHFKKRKEKQKRRRKNFLIYNEK